MAERASAVGTVTYTKQGGTFFSKLISDFGDISQKYSAYDADKNVATGVVPDFTNDSQQPTIEAYITDSKSGAEVRPNTVTWTVNGTTLAFDQSTRLSTNDFNGETGHFKYIAATNSSRAGLKIVKNLVVPFNGSSISISSVAMVPNGTGSTSVPGSYTIPISEGTSNSVIVRISVTNGGILDSTTESVTLTANIESSGGVDISNPAYKWEATNNTTGAFEAVANATGKTLTVNRADVNNARLYKVTVNGSYSDVQRVEDHSDELRVIPNPTPQEEEILEGSNGTVSYKPKMFRGDTEVTGSNVSIAWEMKFYTATGLPVITATAMTIAETELANNGGNVNYVINGVLTYK